MYVVIVVMLHVRCIVGTLLVAAGFCLDCCFARHFEVMHPKLENPQKTMTDMRLRLRLYQKKSRRRTGELVAGDLLSPAMRRTVSTTEASQSAARAVIQAPRRNRRTCFVSSLAVLCNVVIGSITILPTSAAADELPKPKTAYCIGDQAHPGNFGCAEAGWTAGAIHRNLGVPQERLVGSDPEQRMVMSTLVKMERYYDEEVPLMPKDVQDTW